MKVGDLVKTDGDRYMIIVNINPTNIRYFGRVYVLHDGDWYHDNQLKLISTVSEVTT